MKKYLGILLLIILFSGFLIHSLAGKNKDKSIAKSHLFNASLSTLGVVSVTTNDSYQLTDPVMGIVVPHHSLASKLISKSFKLLEGGRPKTVFVLGANHREIGDSNIQTSDYSWNCDYGIVAADVYIVSKIAAVARVENNSFTDEQTIATLIPFIKYYLPEAKIVPVIFKYKTTQREIEELVEVLKTFEDSVFIASIDFSHYLNPNQADIKDEETQRLFNNFDYEAIANLGSDNLDSPAAAITFLKLMQNKKAKTNVLEHGNSSNIENRYSHYTTGYFTIAYIQSMENSSE